MNRQFTQEVDLGFAAYKNKQYDEAISHHQKALQIDPGNKDAFKVYCALGANYFRKGLLDEALNKAQKCLELNADYGVGNGFMGDLLSREETGRVRVCITRKGVTSELPSAAITTKASASPSSLVIEKACTEFFLSGLSASGVSDQNDSLFVFSGRRDPVIFPSSSMSM